ncbi:T-cell-interacting, activating receptor on myeloid cells protein 1-like [Petaurus breviceps papuanus]|uniref:T-cell-interacting, activating receptor on myeloid cells protein 1-like n=1 Tax=Petaurus breviceps papuanus TaxID=3040969 RepID=UPI0036DED028
MGPTVTFLISIDPLPRPTLWAVPSPVVPGAADVTPRCQGHLRSDRFQLWKDGELREERNASWQQAEFVLRAVDASRNGRSYHCCYGQRPLWSELSEPLALVVTEFSLVRLILPSFKVEPGMHVTLQCQQPPQTSSQRVTFTLLKVGTPQALQSQSSAGTSAAFPLLSVRAQDAGNYSCVYYERTAPYQVSEPSEVLKVWVTEREENILKRMNITGVQFLLTHVTPKDSGNYRCRYQFSSSESLWTQHSYPLQLTGTVLRDEPSLSSICAKLLDAGGDFAVLIFLGEPACPISLRTPERRPCIGYPDTEEAKERPREPLVTVAEGPQGMTYAQLNVRALNKRKSSPMEKPTEPTLYATVSGN